MKFGKKGDLSLRYLILAVLGLTVLTVIIIIFLKGSGFFTTKLKTVFGQISGLKPNLTSTIPKK